MNRGDWFNHRRPYDYCDDLTPIEVVVASGDRGSSAFAIVHGRRGWTPSTRITKKAAAACAATAF